MKLNLGCGDHYAPGWLNVDLLTNLQVRPDLEASVLDLPFPDGRCEAIYAGHLLEHLTYDAEVPRALAEWRRVLRSGGRLCIVGPDYDRAVALGHSQWLLDAIVGGEGRWPGDQHQWLSTETKALPALRAVFPTARPLPVAELDELWPVVARVDWQFAIQATR